MGSGLAMGIMGVSLALAVSLAVSLAIAVSLVAISPGRGCSWGKGFDPLDGWRIGCDRSIQCGLEVCPGRQKRRIKGVDVHEPTNPTIVVIELVGVLRAHRIFLCDKPKSLPRCRIPPM